MYKLVARNEKGEATSQVVEVTEIMEEGEKPKIISGLKSAVSFTIETTMLLLSRDSVFLSLKRNRQI